MQLISQEQVEKRVISFISEQTSFSANKINPNSTLGDDLGIDGEDAVELLEEYSKVFGVNLGSFSYDEYFGLEAGASPLSFLLKLLGKEKKLKSIFVQDLIDGVSVGRLL